ncbi:MAG: hypothetical protein KJ749_00505, partial [Planctomycetes bacterium]|nr:hypothetical protein [Planctomycetota bacterium]
MNRTCGLVLVTVTAVWLAQASFAGDKSGPPSGNPATTSNRLEVAPAVPKSTVAHDPLAVPALPALVGRDSAGGATLPEGSRDASRALPCLCGYDPSGTVLCFKDQVCADLIPCTSNADCAAGERCVADNCCPPPTNYACLPECDGGCTTGGSCGTYKECLGNDDCAAAEPLAMPYNGIFSTLAATVDSAPSCQGVLNTAPGIWYSVIGTGDTITASTCSEFCDFDTQITVYC